MQIDKITQIDNTHQLELSLLRQSPKQDVGSAESSDLKNQDHPKLKIKDAIHSLLKDIFRGQFLSQVNLKNIDLGDEGACIIAGHLKTHSIKILILDKTEIQDKGVSAIAQALIGDENLEELHLNHNKFKLEGLTQLTVSLKENKKLTTLSLNNNQLTDEAATHLAQLIILNDTLINFFLKDNCFSVQGKDILSKALESHASVRKKDTKAFTSAASLTISSQQRAEKKLPKKSCVEPTKQAIRNLVSPDLLQGRYSNQYFIDQLKTILVHTIDEKGMSLLRLEQRLLQQKNLLALKKTHGSLLCFLKKFPMVFEIKENAHVKFKIQGNLLHLRVSYHTTLCPQFLNKISCMTQKCTYAHAKHSLRRDPSLYPIKNEFHSDLKAFFIDRLGSSYMGDIQELLRMSSDSTYIDIVLRLQDSQHYSTVCLNMEEYLYQVDIEKKRWCPQAKLRQICVKISICPLAHHPAELSMPIEMSKTPFFLALHGHQDDFQAFNAWLQESSLSTILKELNQTAPSYYDHTILTLLCQFNRLAELEKLEKIIETKILRALLLKQDALQRIPLHYALVGADSSFKNYTGTIDWIIKQTDLTILDLPDSQGRKARFFIEQRLKYLSHLSEPYDHTALTNFISLYFKYDAWQ